MLQERKKEGDRWKVNNAGETMNGDDDDFDPNMRYSFNKFFTAVYGLSVINSYKILSNILMNICMKHFVF